MENNKLINVNSAGTVSALTTTDVHGSQAPNNHPNRRNMDSCAGALLENQIISN